MATIFQYGPFLWDDLVETRQHDFVAEYDGPTYLWTRHRWHMAGVLSPDTVGYLESTSAPAGAAPAGAAPPVGGVPGRFRSPQAAGPGRGIIGARTIAAIRHQLMQPQQRLSVQVTDSLSPGGRFQWFLSPRTGFSTDANNGPTPIEVIIPEQVGSTTLYVEFIIEACVNECLPAPAGSVGVSASVGFPPIFLSHRWEASEDIADNHLSTKTVRGHAILRSDARIAAGLIADQFRAALLHPIRLGVQREDIHVTADEGGNRLDYAFVDAQRMDMLIASLQTACPGLVDVEADHHAGIGKPGFDTLIEASAGVATRTFDRLTRASTGGILGAYGFIPAAAASLIDMATTIAQIPPRVEHTVIGRAYGNALASRKRLERVALAFCRARMNATGLNQVLSTGHLSVEYGWVKKLKVVTVTMRVKEGMVAAVGAQIRAALSAAAAAPAGGGGFLAGLRAGVNLIPGVGPGVGLLLDAVGAIPGVAGAAAPAIGILSGVFAAAESAVGVLEFNRNIMPSSYEDGTNLDGTFTTTPQVQPAPPRDGGTRGTVTEYLAAQVLAQPCALPDLPPPPTLARTSLSGLR